jgi:thiamine-phosphate pyrophosphorylase
VSEAPTGCRLYAVVEAGESASERLAAALATADLAVVLIAPARAQMLVAAEARPLIDQAKSAGVTALVLGDASLARAVGADGVHLGTQDDPQAAYAAARKVLGAAGVIGAEAGISRHAAMLLAEAGADYVGFGAPADLNDRPKARLRRADMIAWWAPIFEVPSVALDVETPEEAEDLAVAGADFIAVTLPAALTAEAARDLVADVARAIGQTIHASTGKPSS